MAGTALIGIHASLYGNWIMDDAAITFAYARSVAEGNGPVLQPGADPVEGFSNPTWMMLLVVGRLLGLFDRGTIFGMPDYVLFPKALALLCCVAILSLFYVAARSLTSRPRLVTLLAGAGLAAVPSFIIWSFSGLENSLYALVVIALAVVMLRAFVSDDLLGTRVALVAGSLAALAALTRPDGMIYVGAYPLAVLLLMKGQQAASVTRAVLISVAAFSALFGGYVVWRYLQFGLLLPNTAVAKSQPTPKLEDVGRAGDLIQYAGWLAVMIVVGCVGVLMLKPSGLRSRMVTLLVPLGLAIVAFCVLLPDWMGEYRFASPIWALGVLVGAVVVVETLGEVKGRERAALAVLIAVAATFSVNQFYERGQAYSAEVKTPLCVVAERDGRTMNAFADLLSLEQPSAGVIDLGGQALTSRLRLVDLAGLGDRRTAEFIGKEDFVGLRNYALEEVKPDFITFIGTWETTLGFSSDPRFARDYHLIYQAPSYPGILLSYNHVGYWVRKDLVPDQAKLLELQSYASARVEPILDRNAEAARRTCGPTLRRGQV